MVCGEICGLVYLWIHSYVTQELSKMSEMEFGCSFVERRNGRMFIARALDMPLARTHDFLVHDSTFVQWYGNVHNCVQD